MKVIRTRLKDVLVIAPKVFSDARGVFWESFNAQSFLEATGADLDFVQDNHSYSGEGVLRGLHYQIHQPQGKLVRVTRGAIFDVAVDIRRTSPDFGCWIGIELSEQNRLQLWMPPGFAHGFLVTSSCAEVLYKTTNYYAPEHERTLRWDDPSIAIKWPTSRSPVLSDRDLRGDYLHFAELPD